MAEKILMQGSHAIAEAALRSGCKLFGGYPFTPTTEVGDYFAQRGPALGATSYVAESEMEAIHACMGAAAAGARVMACSTGSGMAIMAEAISTIASAELPVVLVNMTRGGPGPGNLRAAQSDYWQGTKAAGSGDFRLIVLSPSTVQEAVDLTMEAFYLADKLRAPVMVMTDVNIAYSMETVEFKEPPKDDLPPKNWAVGGPRKGRPSRFVSYNVGFGEGATPMMVESDEARTMLERHVHKLYAKYARVEPRAETVWLDDAEVAVVSFGSAARIAKSIIKMAREEGLRVGLIRPITLFPFPSRIIAEAADRLKGFLVFELNAGQMVEDVRLAVSGKKPVFFYGKPGGVHPRIEEVREQIDKAVREVTKR